MNRISLSIISSLMLAASAFAAPETWEVDTAHSVAAFKVRHLMVSWVHGHITGLTGTVQIDDKNLKDMTVDVTADPKTISTDNAKRDEHLKSDDFFAVAKNPTWAFKTKKVTPGKSGTFKLFGDLTMAGKTKEVTFEGKDLAKATKDMQGGMRRGFTATGKVNRKEFGILWNKTLDGGGIAVGDEVDVTVDLELTPKTEKKM